MYRIKIQKQKHNFSAAHFITFENECEGLHGHNYYVTVEMKGELDDNAYLMDFKIVKSELDDICKSLDHKILMALNNRHLKITRMENELEVRFKSKRYVFPMDDIAELPISNTTVEKLSEYIWHELMKNLNSKNLGKNVETLEIGVEETTGQMASFRKDV